MSEATGEVDSQESALKTRVIPCLRQNSAEVSFEDFAESDPSANLYDSASAASVRLLSESHAQIRTICGPMRVAQKSSGSGAIVSRDGLILTCNHVVQDSETLTAELSSGEVLTATPVFQCPESDLALVQVSNVSNKTLPFLKMSDTTNFYMGKRATVVGHPEGEREVHLSPGSIINFANSRDLLNDPPSHSFKPQKILSITCHIKHGSSGSPVLRADGQVMAVSFAVGDDQSNPVVNGKHLPAESYAVPIATLKKALKTRPDLMSRLGW